MGRSRRGQGSGEVWAERAHFFPQQLLHGAEWGVMGVEGPFLPSATLERREVRSYARQAPIEQNAAAPEPSLNAPLPFSPSSVPDSRVRCGTWRARARLPKFGCGFPPESR